MGQTNKIIEVNGQRYDAVTGAIIKPGLGTNTAATVHSGRHQASGRSVDGFARQSRDQAAKSITKPARTIVHKSAHAAAVHTVAHGQQRATTLMRSAVKKPTAPKSTFKAQLRTDSAPKSGVTAANIIVPKLSYTSVNQQRSQRAEQVTQLSAVSHFARRSAAQTNVPKPRAVASPVHRITPTVVQSVPRPSVGNNLDFIAPPKRAQVRTNRVTQTPRSLPISAGSSDIFAQALANATSHEQTFDDIRKPRTRRRGRAIGYVSASMLVLLIVGFLGFKNSSQLSLKVASYRSGIQAKLPSYQPANYAYNHLDYQPGNVTVSFDSTSGNQEYKISQRASNWDSQALLSNVVSTTKDGYKTYQQAGRTVYVLSNNTATWVDSGILYTVDGNASLTAKQLLDLAGSM